MEKLKAKLDEWNTEIDRLKAKAAESNVDLRNEIETRVADLHYRRQKVEDRMQQLREYGEKAQDDIVDSLQRAWEDFSDALKSVLARYK